LLLSLSLVAPAETPVKSAPIQAALQPFMDQSQLSGAVTLVAQEGKILSFEATGLQDLESHRPMAKDSLFWIASMTKSINATAVMILVEEGKLSLDEPAAKWLPALGEAKLADGTAPVKPITLRHLLSHTAGIAFPPRKATDGASSLKAYVNELLKAPLAFQPGSDYEYGFGPTVSGRIVEIASGMGYADFLRTRIFEPLGMKDTGFYPDDTLRARIPGTYTMNEDTHELQRAYNPFVTSDAEVRRTPEPGGGLFSTAADMGRFYALIAAGGELDGVRLLSAKSIQEMTTPTSAGGRPLPYAFGWQVNRQDQRVCGAMPVGSFGHGGAFATNGWVDAERQIVTVFLVQNVLVPDSGKPRDAFQRIVMEAAGVEVKPPAKKKAAK
ncbi:MAG TPA: hypothetical protein DCP71_01590, partial [Verrucomicrobiales bacterium]|nr:hypothetical protein [Verrucomicrobiales bacterium]